MAEGRSTRAINQHEKLGSVTNRRTQLRTEKDKVSKIFIIPRWLIFSHWKEILKLSGRYNRIRSAKLTNHGLRTK